MKLLTKIILIASTVWATAGLASAAKPTPKTTYGSWDSTSETSVPKGIALSVGGWGADTAAKPTPTSGIVAKIFVDGVLVSQAEMGASRPDVTDFYGFQNCGFNGMIETSNLAPGEHTITIQVGGGPSGWNNYTKPTSKGKGTFTVTAPKPALSVSPAAPAVSPSPVK